MIVPDCARRAGGVFLAPTTPTISALFVQVADMVPDAPGSWMLHCHIDDHIAAGMVAQYVVRASNRTALEGLAEAEAGAASDARPRLATLSAALIALSAALSIAGVLC